MQEICITNKQVLEFIIDISLVLTHVQPCSRTLTLLILSYSCRQLRVSSIPVIHSIAPHPVRCIFRCSKHCQIRTNRPLSCYRSFFHAISCKWVLLFMEFFSMYTGKYRCYHRRAKCHSLLTEIRRLLFFVTGNIVSRNVIFCCILLSSTIPMRFFPEHIVQLLSSCHLIDSPKLTERKIYLCHQIHPVCSVVNKSIRDPHIFPLSTNTNCDVVRKAKPCGGCWDARSIRNNTPVRCPSFGLVHGGQMTPFTL